MYNLLIAGEGGSPQYEVDVTLGPLHAVREGNTPLLIDLISEGGRAP
jgi:hypothetical protein